MYTIAKANPWYGAPTWHLYHKSNSSLWELVGTYMIRDLRRHVRRLRGEGLRRV